jgi:hypothetical protein
MPFFQRIVDANPLTPTRSEHIANQAHKTSNGDTEQLVNGGSPLRLKDAQAAGTPAWSPEGSRLAFVRRDGGIYVMPALGGVPRCVSISIGATNGDLAWSAGGAFFVFTGGGGPVCGFGGRLRGPPAYQTGSRW